MEYVHSMENWILFSWFNLIECLIGQKGSILPAVERAMKICARRPSALISATWTPFQYLYFKWFLFVFAFAFVWIYLDELAPLVLFHIQIKPLRLNLEHLCRKLLIQDCLIRVPNPRTVQECTIKNISLSQAPDSRLLMLSSFLSNASFHHP